MPLLPVTVAGRRGLAISDTETPLAYIAPALVDGLRPAREQEDFHPFAGRFTTPVYRVPTTVAGHTVDLEYGVPRPHVLAEMLRLSGALAIVGGGLLENFDCLVSWRQRRITWVPVQVDDRHGAEAHV